jgi:Zn-dependent peptidase ImmA (M78 family)
VLKLTAPKNTPQEALNLLQTLEERYPLTNLTGGTLTFINRDHTDRHAKGMATRYDDFIHLKVSLGYKDSRRSEQEVCWILAHEYKHALQYDTNELTQALVGQRRFEDQADSFADQIMEEVFKESTLPENSF